MISNVYFSCIRDFVSGALGREFWSRQNGSTTETSSRRSKAPFNVRFVSVPEEARQRDADGATEGNDEELYSLGALDECVKLET